MIEWDIDYYNVEKRRDNEIANWEHGVYANIRKPKLKCANIDVWVCSDGLSFSMSDQASRNACYGMDYNEMFNEINAEIIKEFPHMFNETYFIVHNAAIKFNGKK